MDQNITIASTDLLCFICQDYFCKPETVSCGHTFCYLCLEEYLLFADICPRCNKCIRDKPIHPVNCLGELIENILKKNNDQFSRFQERKEATKKYMKERELSAIKVGMKVDIRDPNNIWCEGKYKDTIGIIVRIITRLDQPCRFLRINYLNYLQKKEEDVPMVSDRLANKGFYTSRDDIPHYGEKVISSLIKKYEI